MARQVAKISDKLKKVNDSFQVYMYDNGFMLEISGKDSEGDWKTAKIMVPNIDQLAVLMQEAAEMERDE